MTPRAKDSLNRIEFLVLSVLTDQARHGYGIAAEIGRTTDGERTVRPGSLYRVIDRLVQRGLVEPVAGPGDGDERRAYYSLTERGRERVRAEARMLAAVARQVLAER